MSVSEDLFNVDTLPAYIANAGLLREAGNLTAVEISGGNLNYSFRVSGNDSGQSIFVKQTPGYVKVLGPTAQLSNERMLLERQAYVEWANALKAAPEAARSLPELMHFDPERMVLVMEYLGSYELLQEQLMRGQASEPIARALGQFLGAAHAATHSSLVSLERSAYLADRFSNRDLRDLQLEYVFSKPFRESERAEELRKDECFMSEVENLKASYRGLVKDNLVLCHGDLHPGSVMASKNPVTDSSSPIKVIDPEFAIYGPPGLDLGCLLSGFALAAVYHAEERTGAVVRELLTSAAAIWEAYAAAMSAGGVSSSILDAISSDAAGFAGCDVARTALGFAGVRGLPIDDEAAKARAEGKALAIAAECISQPTTRSVNSLLASLEPLENCT